MKYSHALAASCCMYKPFADPAAHFAEFAEAGIMLCEVSFPASNVASLNLYDNPAPFAAAAKAAGVTLRSLHLPFGHDFDNSEAPGKIEQIMEDTKKHIRVAAALGISIAVIHPGCEPNLPEERTEKLKRAQENLGKLGQYALTLGVRLAVENLPRTCLGNCASDMIYLTEDSSLDLCFDTNHCLMQKNADFLREIAASGRTVATVHVSDYDFIDERHWLPAEEGGKNDWNAVWEGLEACGYRGPVMYEVNYTPAQIRANYDRMFRK